MTPRALPGGIRPAQNRAPVRMIRIAITPAAFEAVACTLPPPPPGLAH